MKKIFFSIFTLLIAACITKVDNSIIEIPVEFVQGYGPFNSGLIMLSDKPMDSISPWYKTQIKARNIPEDWQDVVVNQLWFDAKQFAYQNYKHGSLTEEFFNRLIESWQIDLVNEEFTDSTLKCFVQIVSGKKDGVVVYKIDGNQNFDFADDPEMQPHELKNFKKLDSLSQYASLVDYEFIHEGQIHKKATPILIVHGYGSPLMWAMPQYARAEFEGLEINIGDFNSIRYEYPKIKIKRGEEVEKETYALNEFVQLEEDIYQFKNLDFKRQLLVMQKMPIDTTLYSTQLGFHAIPFEGKEFTNGEKLSLNDFKGKYLFMEFWGSWCGPCIQEIPHLKKLYAILDKEKVEFIGIAEDSAEPLEAAINKYELEWKQILSDNENAIVKNYGINSFPSSILIDPEGKIIAKNLRGKSLADTLKYFLRED